MKKGETWRTVSERNGNEMQKVWARRREGSVPQKGVESSHPSGVSFTNVAARILESKQERLQSQQEKWSITLEGSWGRRRRPWTVRMDAGLLTTWSLCSLQSDCLRSPSGGECRVLAFCASCRERKPGEGCRWIPGGCNNYRVWSGKKWPSLALKLEVFGKSQEMQAPLEAPLQKKYSPKPWSKPHKTHPSLLTFGNLME